MSVRDDIKAKAAATLAADPFAMVDEPSTLQEGARVAIWRGPEGRFWWVQYEQENRVRSHRKVATLDDALDRFAGIATGAIDPWEGP